MDSLVGLDLPKSAKSLEQMLPSELPEALYCSSIAEHARLKSALESRFARVVAWFARVGRNFKKFNAEFSCVVLDVLISSLI